MVLMTSVRWSKSFRTCSARPERARRPGSRRFARMRWLRRLLMRPHSSGATKRHGEMHSAQSRGAGHICQPNLLTKVLFNAHRDKLKPPLCQSPRFPNEWELPPLEPWHKDLLFRRRAFGVPRIVGQLGKHRTRDYVRPHRETFRASLVYAGCFSPFGSTSILRRRCADGTSLGFSQWEGEKEGRPFGSARRMNAATQTAGQVGDNR